MGNRLPGTSYEFDEEAAVGNTLTDTIYPHDFKSGAGKYFNIVTEEDGATSVEYQPLIPTRNRIKLTFKFIREGAEVTEITLKKFRRRVSKGVPYWEEMRWGPEDPMRFTRFSFQKLLGFLKLMTELDLANLNERRIALKEDVGESFDPETTAKVRQLLRQKDGIGLVDELLRSGSVTTHDLVNIGYRKKQLAIFKELLSSPDAIRQYARDEWISEGQPEKAWQHFLEKNEWIFGYGLDYRFKSILQREAHVGATDLGGRDGAVGDYLLGATNFTVLVEIKRPDTPLFESRRNRAGAWKLSSELVDAVSQILEQKASWQVRAETNANRNYAGDGKLVAQKTVDPKCILIVGSDAQFTGDDKERDIKLRTFELFRRDSRNVEILTYDELLERASFIVGHSDKAAKAGA